MSKYKVVFDDYGSGSVTLEADGYGTNSVSGELYLYTEAKLDTSFGEARQTKTNVATFAQNKWTGVWLLPEETKADV